MSVLVSDSDYNVQWREYERRQKFLKSIWRKLMKLDLCDCRTCRDKRGSGALILAVIAFFVAAFIYAAFWK